MKQTLMIHDFKSEYLDLPLEDYILTFDDGLVSPLEYWDEISRLDTQKIFFIPTSAIGGDGSIEGKNPSLFMTRDEVDFLYVQENVTIGGHSHFHKRLVDMGNFIETIEFIHEDTEMMCEWFKKHLGFLPTHYCYPYNETNGVYESILKLQFFFKHLYGAERIDIEELL